MRSKTYQKWCRFVHSVRPFYHNHIRYTWNKGLLSDRLSKEDGWFFAGLKEKHLQSFNSDFNGFIINKIISVFKGLIIEEFFFESKKDIKILIYLEKSKRNLWKKVKGTFDQLFSMELLYKTLRNLALFF